MVSMLHALAGEESERQVWFVHGVRDGGHHPLIHEVRKLAAKRESIRVHVAYSRPRPKDQLGVEYDSEGRVDGALLASLTDNIDAHCFLCGPTRFMTDIQSDLERRNIPSEHIHSESFGPKD
jgi:ferredoxin-NADP reductase